MRLFDVHFGNFTAASTVVVLMGFAGLICAGSAQAQEYSAVRVTNAATIASAMITPSARNITIGSDASASAFFRVGGTNAAGAAQGFMALNFANASFGLPGTISDITNVRLNFTANQDTSIVPFTDGNFEFFLASNVGSISALMRFNSGATASPNGVPTTTTTGNNGGANFGTLQSLGTLSATGLPTSGAVVLGLNNLNVTGKQTLLNALNGGQDIRLIVAAADPTVRASWLVDNTNAANRPTLTITAGEGVVVPEAGTGLLALAGLTISAVVVARRRSAA